MLPSSILHPENCGSMDLLHVVILPQYNMASRPIKSRLERNSLLICTFHGISHLAYSESSEPMNIFRYLIRLYLYRTAQHKKTQIYIHASSGFRTHDRKSWSCPITHAP